MSCDGMIDRAIIVLILISFTLVLPEASGDQTVGRDSMIDDLTPQWWTDLSECPDRPDRPYDPFRDLIIGRWFFDPAKYEDLYSGLPDLGGSGLSLVQFHGPVDPDIFQEFEVVDVVSSSTLLVDDDGCEGQEINSRPGVRATAPYHPVFKLESELLDRVISRNGQGLFEVVMGLYRMPAGDEMAYIEGRDAFFDLNSGLLYLDLSAADIAYLSAEGWISHISTVGTIGADNDIAAEIMDVEGTRSTLSLNGTGQVIAVCDTGLDTGSNSTIHQDFKGRIKAAYSYGRTGNWSDPDIHVWNPSTQKWDYKGGHGTHVAGSALGNGSASNGTYSGMAPAADLVFQSTMTSTGSLSIPSYTRLFNDAFKNGARIQTNSWSSRSSYGNYTWRSWQTDNYLWGHKNLTVLFSSGNKGHTVGDHSVSTQASSKNVIAVGASENYRPNVSSSADNVSEMAYFSSFGPTWGDNRIKPDVVAPGTYILSTRASTISDFWNHYWGSNSTYVGVNSKYAYLGGTSMSTPLVAGITALIRQYYEELEGQDDPSSALVKATLINGARPLNGNWSSIPNKYEGWGRVNLSNSLCTNDSDAGVLSFVDNKTGLSTGSTHERLYTLSGGGADMVVTLVWTDYPGSNTSSTKLVNDLDLKVTAPNGKVYKGNGLVYNSTSQHDRRNNVERVLIRSPSSGVYGINVSGYSVSQGPQPYALVLSGNISGAASSLNWKAPFVPANGSSADFELSDANLTGEGWVRLKVNTSSDTDGEMINLTEDKVGGKGIGIFKGSVKVTTSMPGPGEVRVTRDEPVTVHYNEQYPRRSVSSSIMAYIPAEISDVSHDSNGITLTYQDRVIVSINGTAGWKAEFDVVGLGSRQGIAAEDDGIAPDVMANDGIYTGEFTVPNLVVGNYTIRGTIKRSYLPPVHELSASPLIINTNIPRSPLDLSAEPVLIGNSIKLSWESPGDVNLMSYMIYRANESSAGSGEPDDIKLVHTTPDNRTYWVDDGLIDGRRYFYRIRSLNILGFLSEPTEWVRSVPRDETPPRFSFEAYGGPHFVNKVYEINYTTDPDAREVLFHGALDHNNDGDPDTDWALVGRDDTPQDPYDWDTTQLSSPLTEGSIILVRARVEDEAENVNVTDRTVSFIVDNTPPNYFSVSSELVSVLNVSVYRLTGLSEPYAVVKVMKDGSEFISCRADEDGSFETFLTLEEGGNTFRVLFYDRLGNGPSTLEEEVYVVYDPYEPEARISMSNATTSAPFFLDASSSRFIGPDTPLSGLINYTWSIMTRKGEVVLYGKVVDLNIDIPGTYEVSLHVIDSARNHDFNITHFQVTDTDPPQLAEMEDLVVKEDEEIVLSHGYLEDNDPEIMALGSFTWSIMGPDEKVLTGSEVIWTFFTPGSYLCELTVTDTGGCSDSTSFNILVQDVTPPDVIAGEDREVIRGGTISFSAGETKDNDPMFPLDANFTWVEKRSGNLYFGKEVSITFHELGEHRIQFKVVDASGNVDHDIVVINVVTDGTPPELVHVNFRDDPRNMTEESDLLFIFNEEIDPDTIFANIRLQSASGVDIPAEISLSDPRTLVIDPEDELDDGVVYYVFISNGLTDATGERMVPTELEFVVFEPVSIVSVDGSSSFQDEMGYLGKIDVPRSLDIRISGTISINSSVHLIDENGSRIDLQVRWDPENRRFDVLLEDDLEPGRYIMVLDIRDELGRGINGSDRLSFDIVEPETSSHYSGEGGRLFILITAAAISVLLLAAALMIFIRNKKKKENEHPPEQENSPDGPHGAFNDRSEIDSEMGFRGY